MYAFIYFDVNMFVCVTKLYVDSIYLLQTVEEDVL